LDTVWTYVIPLFFPGQTPWQAGENILRRPALFIHAFRTIRGWYLQFSLPIDLGQKPSQIEFDKGKLAVYIAPLWHEGITT